MEKATLIEYIKGKTTSPVTEQVQEWITQSPQNLDYFTRLKDEYVISAMPNSKATPSQMKIAFNIMDSYPRARRNNTIFKIINSAAAILIIGLVINTIYLYRTKDIQEPVAEIVPANRISLNHVPQTYMHTIYTNKGAKSVITLPDGSTVKLNSDTKLVFPDKFIGSTREIFVTGEAFFDVKPNPDTPMVVSTDKNIFIKVTGTKFNIRAYKNESSTKATLYSGKIEVLGKNKEGAPYVMTSMKPNESYEVRENVQPLKVLKADTLKLSAWTRGELMFEYAPLSDVIKELERWHGASFEVANERIYNHKFSAKFKQESLVQILEVLKFCTGIEYEIGKDKVILK